MLLSSSKKGIRMEVKVKTTKSTPRAIQLLRLIAATTGEKQYQIVERIAEREWKRIQKMSWKAEDWQD